MAASGLLKASVIFALAIGAAAQFPCGDVAPCVDDPTFLLFNAFPCNSGVGPSPCGFPAGAAACALQCLTCEICTDPEPIPGIDIVFQYATFGDALIYYVDSAATIAGFQAQLGCSAGGVETILEITGGALVGEYVTSDFTLSTGIEGKFLAVSLTGGNVAPGYNQVGSINIDPSSENLTSCDPGTIGLYNIIVSDPAGGAIETCGGFDDPCPAVSAPPPSTASPPVMMGDLTFPCDPVPPCVNDPDFFLFNTFPCGNPDPSVCLLSPDALVSCPLECKSCEICQDPEPIDGINAIIQFDEIESGELYVYIDSDIDIAGIQGQLSCISDGEIIIVDILPPPDSILGPVFVAPGFTLSTGTEGKWLTISFSGGVVDHGYSLLAVLGADTSMGSNFSSCDPGSLGLINVVIAGPTGEALEVCGPLDDTCFPPPSPPASSPPVSPSPIATAISDPHFVGFQGQVYDVTGVAGKIYSLIADEDLYLNARFSKAFTTGLYVDPESAVVYQMRPRGTWMSEIGAVINGFQVAISVEPSREIEECQRKPTDCLRFGSVKVNGADEVHFVGTVKAPEDVDLTLSNKKSVSTLLIESEHLEMEIDVVPPPQAWETTESKYFHLNMNLKKVELTAQVSGVLGDSARVKYNSKGDAILSAYDKDGAGILDKPVEQYIVDSLLSTSVPLFQGESSAISAAASVVDDTK